MKKFFACLVVFLFLLTACAPAVQGLTQLPDEGRILVLFVVSAGVTWLLLQLSVLTKIDLNGYAPAVAAALAPIIVTIVESALGLIPPAFDNIVLTLIHLLVLLVGSLGAFFLAKRKAPTLR